MIKEAKYPGLRNSLKTVDNVTYSSSRYSILLIQDDGRKEIIEGGLETVNQYLQYMTFDNSADQLRAIMQEHEQHQLEMQKSMMLTMFDVFRPVPDITNLDEVTAKQRLVDAGFRVEYQFEYPKGIPFGVVKGYYRDAIRPMDIILDVRHELPNVIGLNIDHAIALLKSAGFQVSTECRLTFDACDNTVQECHRESEFSMNVRVISLKTITDTKEMKINEAQQRLHAEGIQTLQHSVFNNFVEEGIVIESHIIDSNTVSLVVSLGREFAEAKQIDASWSLLPDSIRDHYTFSASINRRLKELTLNTSLISSCTKKARFDPSFSVSVGGEMVKWKQVPARISNSVIVPDERIDISLVIPLNDALVPPSQLSILYGVNFGIFRKSTDQVKIDLQLLW